MSLGEGTAVVNGQRTTVAPAAAFLPTMFGAQTTGVPNVTPIIPPYAAGSTSVGGAAASGYGSVGGYGTADNNALATQIAADHPYNAKVSPVWWAVGALLGGLLLLQAVSWRETIEAGNGHASASVEGGAS